jgi:hypothetical protein
MAKLNKWDKANMRNIAAIERQVDEIFNTAAREAAALGASISSVNPDRLFSFDDYPQTKDGLNKLLQGLNKKLQVSIVSGIRSGWTLSNNKNNELSRQVFGDNVGKLSQQAYRRYFSTNDDARKAFEERITNGLKLSDRVWNYTNQFKSEIEMGLDLGLRDGLSAAEMSRDLRKYLKYPDKLFRRVRDEHGQLHLSKAAKAFNPGRGVYRSSYKNARRLAATETNIAYHTADYIRWQQLDFVVGIEIKLSGNHPVADICDELAGKYPKDFKFVGWHPHCRCHALSVLKTPEEIKEDTRRLLNGEPPDGDSVNRVDDVPPQFKQWTANNEKRLTTAKSMPYFVRDNEKYFPQMRITDAAAKGVKEAQTFNEKLEASTTAPISQQGTIKAVYPELTEKVIDIENSIRKNSEFETAVAFGKNGNIVIDKRGATTSVAFTNEECAMMKDCVLTHNHPRGWSAKENTIGRIGNSFSYDDISLSINRDVAEIRAVTPTYTFSMKRPTNGWGVNVGKLKNDFDIANENMQIKMFEIIDKAKTLENMRQATERANTLHFHLIWKELAKKYGWKYTKTKSIL